MGEKGGRIESLTPFKKGHAALKGCGRPKGSFSFATIVRKMLEAEPEEFLNLCVEDKNILLELKKHSIKIENVKDLIGYKIVTKAAEGDLKSIIWIIKQIGEDASDTLDLRLCNNEEAAKTIEDLTDDQLKAVINGTLVLD